MTIDRLAPLVGPDHEAIRRDLAIPMDEYSERFIDIEFWRPYIDLIAGRHGVPVGDVTMGEPGTFPTFILNRSHVIKLFGNLFDGLRCWQVELEVSSMLGAADVAVPVPELVAAGVLSRDPDWNYTITRFLEGEAFAERRDSMSERERIRVAGELGVMVRSVHDAAIPDGSVLRPDWDAWTSFVDRQIRVARERHRGWGVLAEHLREQIACYVANYRVPDDVAPSLVHADLHGHHLFGELTARGDWDICGVIDWEDAQAADRFYELPALHLGLFHGDKAMLAAFLESYGWDDYRSDGFVQRAMTMTLLHEFNVLEKVDMAVEFGTFDQLADAIWRV